MYGLLYISELGSISSLGKCFCLYPEDSQLLAENSPQILESNITPTVLFLKRMEIAGLGQCDFINRPGEGSSLEETGLVYHCKNNL